ncbi:hypothetical protein ACOSQ3_012986 [Xanthoceras sorbifolium]
MTPLHFFVKFLGSSFQFRIVNPKMYTLHTLCCDVYMLQCSTFPKPAEKFKVEINLPWTGQYQILNMLTARRFDRVIVEIQLLSLAMDPPLEADYASSSYRETPCQNTIETFDVSNEEGVNEEEAEDQLSFALDIGGKDVVLKETESDGD